MLKGGVINGTEIAFDFMHEQGGGVIVNIGSIAGMYSYWLSCY